MPRCTVNLAAARLLEPASFVNSEGRTIAWLEIHDGSGLGLWGTSEELRALAAAASSTADQADEMQRVAEELAAAGVPRVNQLG